jgi:putative redox protein
MKKTNVSVKWTGNRQFVGTDSGKHSVVLSSHDDDNHTGVKPSDMLLIALGACAAYDVVSILEKKRKTLTALEVSVSAEQEESPPWTFRRIHIDFAVNGLDLKDKQVKQATSLSLEKYCSVASTISGMAEITHSFTILDQDQAD